MCALWHFRLGDRALDPWACGRRTARGQSWSCWPTARPAAVFRLGLGDRRWRSSSPTAAGNSWPQGSLRMCSHSVGFWHWPGAIAPLNLLGNGAALAFCWSFSRAREGGALASGFDRRRRRAAMGDCSARADRKRWPGVAVACVRSGISGWVIGLLIRGRAGAEQRAANEGKQGGC